MKKTIIMARNTGNSKVQILYVFIKYFLLETQGFIVLLLKSRIWFLVFIVAGQFALKYQGRTILKFQAKFYVYSIKYYIYIT